MCGRFTMTSPVAQIQDLFAVKHLPAVEAHYNIAPTQDVLALRLDEEGEREAMMMRWGLIPFWAEDKSIGSRMINARSETVEKKPAFRDAFERRRCLVAADGFFEWKKVGSKKQPFHIRLRDRCPFAFAGLWDRWRDENGEWVISCTILTTDANELVEPIHDRMPVMLHRVDHELWLDTNARKDDVTPLLVPYDADEMEAVAVSTRVNSVKNDDPECLEPVEVQGDLL